ncbi:MAG: response regulator [Lachnospiraceae bacterium]|nr:response regulator [Lachnospiraceae bacterium]
MRSKWISNVILSISIIACMLSPMVAYATEENTDDLQAEVSGDARANANKGGGYAVSGQLAEIGYSMQIYDESNGLPTSDANCVLSDSKGYMWIGGYAGIFRYDGISFERLPSTEGLTSGRSLFEDSKGRIWVGTNDNGIVVIDGDKQTHITYKDGLKSSTIRTFVEDDAGRIFAGTSMGVCLISDDYQITNFTDATLKDAYVLHMVKANNGYILGVTKNGVLFRIKDGWYESCIAGDNLGIGAITAVCPDPENPEFMYLGNDEGKVYYGEYGDYQTKMKEIDVSPAISVNWMTYACGRIWVVSDDTVGYLDDQKEYVNLSNLPLTSGIEMLVEDYQGNLWMASSRQGVAKVVANNFHFLSEQAGLEEQVVNTTCLYNGKLYIGTDHGLQIIDENQQGYTDELTEYLAETRIRCIRRDGAGNLWIACYNNGKGLTRYSSDGSIYSFTEENGFITNSVRCVYPMSDGSVIVGTNNGAAVIKGDQVIRTYGRREGMANLVCLSVEEGPNGDIIIGTDGGGMYVASGNEFRHYGRGDGMTSDVLMRSYWDETRGIYWLVTSNSLQYLKDGLVYEIKTFPYADIFDVCFDNHDNLWVISAYGLICLKADDVLNKSDYSYQVYDGRCGLTSEATANSYIEKDDEGNIYLAERLGVDKVNINNFFQQNNEIRIGLKNITCSTGEIVPREDGVYEIPSDAGRIQIHASVLNYSLSNPTIHIFLEGDEESGIEVNQRNITALEYTNLPYGNYTLHVQIVDEATREVYKDSTFAIDKRPRVMELFVVKLLLLALLALVGGLIVWRIMSGTVIRRQYREIAAAKEEADRANSAKSRFLANMSHEIRTPINTILGMNEMILREDPTGVPKPYFLAMMNYSIDIRQASEALLGLINDILDLSKIESGKMHLVEQEYDPAEQIRGMIKMIRVRSDQKDLNFDVDVDENLPRRLYGDSGKIKQVVLNLLTNAVKYTKEGGFTLTVKVLEKSQERCRVLFSVKDTGIGVRPEDMDKLFSAFERLDENKNSGIQGTGLGLDISRQFAELMNGKLTCDSVYGEGSDFQFVIEQKIIDAAPIGVFDEDEEPMAKGPYVPKFVAPDAAVLVVDDNPMNLTVIKNLLAATKVFVSTATSGEECLNKLKEGSFDVILLDHMMPGMDGIETLEKIRERYKDLPVYALTANLESDGGEFYKSKGFNGYLSKPIDSETLELTILKHLPEESVMIPQDVSAGKSMELPPEYDWVRAIEGIDPEEGIKNSGGVDTYIYSLGLFHDTIESNAAVIEKAWKDGDIKLFTTKVHALKSSARIIGEINLSKLSLELEEAGKKGDKAFIDANAQNLLDLYRSYLEIFKRIAGSKEVEQLGVERHAIPKEALEDAVVALKELVPAMDYDGVEMVLQETQNYRLEKEDAEWFSEMEKALRVIDWDHMEELLGARKK